MSDAGAGNGLLRAMTAKVPVAALVIFCPIAALLLMRFGADAEMRGLEAGWSDALAWAFLHDQQWGRDIVYTYGPLGFLQPWSRYVSGIFPWYIAGQILLPAAFVFATGLLLAAGSRWTFALFVAAFLVAMTWLPGDVCWALTLLFGTTWLIDACATRSSAWHGALVLLAPLFAIVALTKFSVFSLWAACTAALTIACLFESGARRAATAFAACVVSLGTVWLACGQELPNLFDFVATGLEVAWGYKHAMGGPALPGVDLYGLAILGLFLASCTVMAGRLRAIPAALTRIALAASAAVLFWLAFFTRGDHAPWFFPAMSLLPFTLLCSRNLDGGGLAKAGLALVVVAGMLVQGTAQSLAVIPAYLAGLGSPVRNLQRLPELLDAREARWRSLAREPLLPQISRRIGSARVDLLMDEQGVIVIGGMNYAPRPVFQSFVANTTKLQRLNESYFLGPDAPEFAILQINVIDERVPTGEDALALAALLRRYRPVLQEKGFLLLQRDDAIADLAPILPPDQSAIATFGAEVPIAPSATPQMFFARIGLNRFGQIYTLLFREPPLWITFETANGERRRYRLIRTTVESGFLLNPLVRLGDDWVKLYAGMPLPQARSVRIDTDSMRDRWLFSGAFSIATRTLPIERAPRDAPISDLANDAYPGFNVPALSTREMRIVNEDAQPAAFLHAPATLTFVPAPARYSIRGVFGIVAGALHDPGCASVNPDGIGASLVLSRGGGERTLWHRDIDPFHVEPDRGPQRLQAEDVDIEPGDRVEYRVDTGPSGSSVNCDWSYVRGLQFVPRAGPDTDVDRTAGGGETVELEGANRSGLRNTGAASLQLEWPIH